MTLGRGRAAELHGPWPDPEEQRLAAFKEQFPDYRVWRAVRDDRVRTDWCARHEDSGEEFTEATPDALAEKIKQPRGRMDG